MSFLARRGLSRDRATVEEDGTIKYPVDTFMHEATEEELAWYVERLPLVVPGLEVVRTAREPNPWKKGGFRSTVWFTWSYEAMRARYEDLVARHGIADPRLDFMECGGEREGTYQLTLDGMPEPEPVSHGGAGIFVSWTAFGLAAMDGGFAMRIMEPNTGGPDHIPFDQVVEYGTEWWLVGSRGDSFEVMEIEILASPLDNRTKDNLLYNLRNYRKGEAA